MLWRASFGRSAGCCSEITSLTVENFDPDLPVLGTSTQSAMKSGVLWGYGGLIDGLLNRLKAEPGMAEAVVIGTGGLSLLPRILML